MEFEDHITSCVARGSPTVYWGLCMPRGQICTSCSPSQPYLRLLSVLDVERTLPTRRPAPPRCRGTSTMTGFWILLSSRCAFLVVLDLVVSSRLLVVQVCLVSLGFQLLSCLCHPLVLLISGSVVGPTVLVHHSDVPVAPSISWLIMNALMSAALWCCSLAIAPRTWWSVDMYCFTLSSF